MATGLATPAPDWRAGLAGEWPFLLSGGLLFVATAAATVYLSTGMNSGVPATSDVMPLPGADMSGQAWLSQPGAFMGMWVVMMAAMMLPSLVPELLGYRRGWRLLGRTKIAVPTTLAAAAYLLVWAGIGVLAYLLSTGVALAQLQWMDLARFAPAATGLVLLSAGVFQLTAFKARHLECCRQAPVPLSTSGSAAWRAGLNLGVHCVACCCGLMAVLLATNVMSLGLMVAVAAAITFERLGPWPRLVARAIGLALILIGLVVVYGRIWAV